MNRLMQWVMAAALICSSTVFTSCSNDDNSVDPAKNLSEKIIGKWMQAEIDGKPAPTDFKSVYTFISTTKAIANASKNKYTETNTRWIVDLEYAVEIDENDVKLTANPNEKTTLINELAITAINDTELFCNFTHTTLSNGQITGYTEQIRRYEKITTDYKEDVLGLWECKGLKGGETFNDANARLEFYEDGTYNYWRKNEAGEWESVTSTREFQNYFVDGTLLATRWKNVDEDELREWWEIAYLKGDKMQWKALRANEDGTTFEQTMDWEKVE